ncbi:hypothetical protein [Paenibacillus sp. DMB5]|uniref:hypothetical protein n=1 Tax=Paenibacillus sp. DMB5 TaxID=1780103 RepID=UPI00076C3884|nr:hypothetical protein [Paenibacillus sp. DMB5]KUP25565.1 hypothetical protein AWJ19_17375 [Paenibacillus sp. DMB5]
MKMKPYEHPPALYPYREWSLGEDTYEEEHNQRSESVFALGNGYIGMRGNFEEGYHGAAGTTVAGNYLNGFYDSEPIVYPEGAYGLPAVNQSMLNVTEARIIGLEIEGHAFRLDRGNVHSFRRWLDMQTGLLHREVEWESPAGHRAKLVIRRMVCLRHKHLAAIDYAVTALNFAGTLQFVSALDGEIRRAEASADPRLGSGAPSRACCQRTAAMMKPLGCSGCGSVRGIRVLRCTRRPATGCRRRQAACWRAAGRPAHLGRLCSRGAVRGNRYIDQIYNVPHLEGLPGGGAAGPECRCAGDGGRLRL